VAHSSVMQGSHYFVELFANVPTSQKEIFEMQVKWLNVAQLDELHSLHYLLGISKYEPGSQLEAVLMH